MTVKEMNSNPLQYIVVAKMTDQMSSFLLKGSAVDNKKRFSWTFDLSRKYLNKKVWKEIFRKKNSLMEKKMAGNRNPYVQRSISQSSPQSPYKKGLQMRHLGQVSFWVIVPFPSTNPYFKLFSISGYDVVRGWLRREFSRRHRTLHSGREDGAKSARTNHSEKRPEREVRTT